ncbi:MAG: cob(I)yrinic acid a,c-diamide adenosyltransferase [Acidobacteria bacterium]|nr:cob(I)yrinic acid a,c-diamide adenosyltransferase [Acidobacteriota bacterium]MCB9396459.1 cob(I)yrinic acid a,c-diamide adenosyltransferase [Acidobacteriota bacterium]
MTDSFRDPKLSISKVYTKTGDVGKTSLVGGQRVPKFDLQIEAYGTLDELNAFLGATRDCLAEQPSADPLNPILVRIQHELFNLGSILATRPQDMGPQQPRIRPADVERLEQEIDQFNANLAPLRSFVLPGGSALNSHLHICRTVCRRAERVLSALLNQHPEWSNEAWQIGLIYLNRLSDAFFVWSRWVLQQSGQAEHLWQPNISPTKN